MHDIAFLITNKYQIHHFAPIARALRGDPHFVIEIRDDDFGVSEPFVREHVPDAQVEWIHKRDLHLLDGRYTAIVCQTPVLPQVFLRETLVVAQQYSLAKERYQFGVWRSLADLNLMFGEYSVDQVGGFANARAVGNPMFDRLFESVEPKSVVPPAPHEGLLRVLYLPTYGSLTSLNTMVERLRGTDTHITIKFHHMAKSAERDAVPTEWSTAGSEIDPIELLRDADVVITDYSGAAFDAAYARRPLLLVDGVAPTARDLVRLSDADLRRGTLGSVSVRFEDDVPLADQVDAARSRAADSDAYLEFIDRHFVNHGTAAAACAEAILELVEQGRPDQFGWSQVRNRNQELMLRNRALNADVRRLRTANDRLRGRAGRTLADRTERATRRARAVVARSPQIERRAVQMKHAVTRLRSGTRPSPAPTILSAPVATPRTPAAAPAPWQRRGALVDALRERAAAHGVHLPLVWVDDRPLFALRNTDKRALVSVLRQMHDTVGDVTVVVGSSVQPAGTLRLADIELAQRIEVRSPDETDQVAVSVYFVARRLAVGRMLTLDSRAAKVDWTDDFDVAETGLLQAPPRITREFDGEIDAVYTWVDSSDPAWQAHRLAHSGSVRSAGGPTMPSADNDERYLDRDELRYSLRSLWCHAPFLRRIHIVTSGQVPDWLDRSDPRINLVEHREIFPDVSALPTFNSHAIEACLHRIPGLAEHFVYLNDDFFVGREITPGDLFTRSGLTRARFAPSQFIYDGEPPAGAVPTDWAAYNATRIIERDFSMSFDRKHQHVPYSLTRSLLEEMDDRYADEFDATRRARFRSPGDLAVPSMFAQFYAVASGKGVEWETTPGDYVYADTGRADADRRYAVILEERPKFFCLNSTLHGAFELNHQAVSISRLLTRLLPTPSPFEKSV